MRFVYHKQKGFTLIELLVTIGILGLLAAVAVPNVARFAGQGGTQAAAAEVQSVQTAMDTAMSDLGLTAVNAQATGISDFSSVGAADIDPGTSAVYLYPDYMRIATSGGASTTYTWDATGKVTQAGTWK